MGWTPAIYRVESPSPRGGPFEVVPSSCGNRLSERYHKGGPILDFRARARFPLDSPGNLHIYLAQGVTVSRFQPDSRWEPTPRMPRFADISRGKPRDRTDFPCFPTGKSPGIWTPKKKCEHHLIIFNQLEVESALKTSKSRAAAPR